MEESINTALMPPYTWTTACLRIVTKRSSGSRSPAKAATPTKRGRRGSLRELSRERRRVRARKNP
jgi:hypothetical protein